MFENYGEVPEKVREEDEEGKDTPSKLETAGKGLSEDEDRLFRFIVDKLDEENYDQYEHLPDDKEDHLAALMRHARAEDATFGTDEHHSNGFDVALVRQTWMKFKGDYLGLEVDGNPKNRGDARFQVWMDPEEKGWLNKHDEFRPKIRVRDFDMDGMEDTPINDEWDSTYPTPLHAIPAVVSLLFRHKVKTERFLPRTE